MNTIEHYIPEMIATRRQIHQKPEEGWTEFETTALVVERLESFGYTVSVGQQVIAKDAVMGRNPELVDAAIARARTNGVSEELLNRMGGYTGAVAVLETGRPGPTTAFRFDLDCVLVEESQDPSHLPVREGFCSTRPGLMHACGHDAHTATGLALAHWLMDHKDELVGRIKLIFQPAEEGTRGASAMATAGVVDDVDWFFGAHVGAECKLGEVGVVHKGFLATTKIDIFFKGVPSHTGIAPEKGHSALMAAATCALSMQAIPRHGQGATRISVGTLTAGEGRNVTPVHAKMQVETRGETAELNTYMVGKIDHAVRGAAEIHEVEGWWVKTGEATNLVSSPEACEVISEVAQSLDGIHVVQLQGASASEDCCTFVQRAQEHGAKAAFFFYGCDHHGHHRSDFEIQDTVSLPVALRMLVGLATRLNSTK